MARRYLVKLSTEEREHLQRLVRSGTAPARKITRARILLKADRGVHAQGPPLIDRDIAEALDSSVSTVLRLRRQFCREGLEAAINRAPTTRLYDRALDGRAEAHLIALACSEVPEGRARWTVRLLADKMVELGHVEALSRESVRRTLKKTSYSLTGRSTG